MAGQKQRKFCSGTFKIENETVSRFTVATPGLFGVWPASIRLGDAIVKCDALVGPREREGFISLQQPVGSAVWPVRERP